MESRVARAKRIDHSVLAVVEGVVVALPTRLYIPSDAVRICTRNFSALARLHEAAVRFILPTTGGKPEFLTTLAVAAAKP